MQRLLDRKATPFWLTIALSLTAVAAALVVGADPAEKAGLAARWTARAALPLFLVTYVASSVFRIWPSDGSRALLRHRRQWGLSFALAHTIHFIALSYNVVMFDRSRPWFVLAGGAVAYGFVLLMAATSSDAAVRKLGRHWKQLHRIGIHFIWIVFAQSYVRSIFLPDPDKHYPGIVASAMLLSVLGLRLYARFHHRPPSA